MTVSINHLCLEIVFEAAWRVQDRADAGCHTPSPLHLLGCSTSPRSSNFLHYVIWFAAMGFCPWESNRQLLWGAFAGVGHPSLEPLDC